MKVVIVLSALVAVVSVTGFFAPAPSNAESSGEYCDIVFDENGNKTRMCF